MTPSEIINEVRRIEIRSRQLVTDSISGAYHSSFKGRGMDFEEVREYSIGDDVRSIDWNVSAKMDKPYIKVFREERELTLFLVIDLSASGIFGSVRQSKRERAAEIASVLAFSATLNNDKVGLVLYTDDVEHYIPPKKGRSHILRVIRDILFFKPLGRGTQHRVALNYLNRVQKRKAVVFLVSDFQESDAQTFTTLALTNQRHDLISIVLSDPRESQLPNVGLITLEDAETGELVEVDTGSSGIRTDYQKQALRSRDIFKQQMRKKGLDWIEASTDQAYIPALRRLFARRTTRN
ncbi:MAG: DUF58 domain-containing protein [Verrucomicrobiota bacterium]|nr:DUF58 domain-containing protein [Verrucomicrobiota bacterium]